MKKKKTLTGFIVVMLVLFLAACGSSSSSGSSGSSDSGSGGNSGTSASTSSNSGSQASQQSEAKDTASKYPEREIQLIVPFAAGGASDSISRIIAKGMEEHLQKPVVVVNKTGGTGGVGLSFVEASANDGYIMGYTPVELTMHKPLGLSELEPSKFEFIAQVTKIPAAVTVPIDAPYNTLEEFVEYARNNKLTVGSSGAGSIWHVAAAAFGQAAGFEFNHVPFDGAAPAVTALMGGHIDVVMVSVGEVKSGIEAGKLKLLGVMSNERDPNFPDVPTLKEAGYDVEIAGWGGFILPKGTPQDIIDILAEAIEKAAQSDEFKEFTQKQGMLMDYKKGAEFKEFAESQFQFFSELIPTMGLK